MRAEFSEAVKGAVVEASGAVGLGLQSYADVFNGPGEEGVGEAGEGPGGVELGVGEGWRVAFEGVAGFELSAGVVEAPELDGDLINFVI